jgi:hypothetical protein
LFLKHEGEGEIKVPEGIPGTDIGFKVSNKGIYAI